MVSCTHLLCRIFLLQISASNEGQQLLNIPWWSRHSEHKEQKEPSAKQKDYRSNKQLQRRPIYHMRISLIFFVQWTFSIKIQLFWLPNNGSCFNFYLVWIVLTMGYFPFLSPRSTHRYTYCRQVTVQVLLCSFLIFLESCSTFF